MPNFESPIGGRKFAGQAMKDFVVPDESEQSYPQPHAYQRAPDLEERSPRGYQVRIDETSDFERDVQVAREVKRTGKERISEGAKRRIEMLLGMVQSTREFTVEGNTFVLRTLKSKEMRDSFIAVEKYDGTIQAPYEIRRQLLARSLTHIAGVEIDQFLSSSTLESRFAFLDELDESLLSRIYDEYVELDKESKQKFAIKDEQDVKEVLADIKKS